MLDNYKHDEDVQLIWDEKTQRHVYLGVGDAAEIFYKKPKWYQWRLRRKLSKMPKVTDPSLAAILRNTPKRKEK